MPLAQIQSLINDELAAVNTVLAEGTKSEVPLIQQLCTHIIEGGGKRLRPMVVLLSARCFNYAENAHINLAAAIEYFHTATLLHDDVIDESATRRGRKTANNVFGSKPSILVGDYLFTRAFQLMLSAKKIPVLQVLADASNTITRGEVLQLSHCNNPNVSEQDYLQVIHDKTAILFAAASKIGALLTEQTNATVDAMHAFGVHLGNAFQIVDDILDYRADEETLGKSLGDDLAEGKLTLPLIYAMNKANDAQRNFIIQTVSDGDHHNLSGILSIIDETKAVETSYQVAQREVDNALSALSAIPPNQYRDALASLAHFSLSRFN